MVVAVDERLRFLYRIFQGKGIGQGLQDGQVQGAGEELPSILAVVQWGIDGVHAGKVHVAQDEGHDRRLQTGAAGEAAGGDDAAVCTDDSCALPGTSTTQA